MIQNRIYHDTRNHQLHIDVAGSGRFTCQDHIVPKEIRAALVALVEQGNTDKRTIKDITDMCENIESGAVGFHDAKIWKRVWWAIVNDLPYGRMF